MPKNKAAFSLSSHLGLDWSFRTTASPVIVIYAFELLREDRLGSSLLRATMSRFISTSCSSSPTFELLRVLISVHLYFAFDTSVYLYIRAAFRTNSSFCACANSVGLGSSDAQRGSPTTNQDKAVLQQPISLSGYTKFKKLPKPCFSCPGSPISLKSKVLKVIWSAR